MKCPICKEEMGMERDLLDLMPDEYWVCEEHGVFYEDENGLCQ